MTACSKQVVWRHKFRCSWLDRLALHFFGSVWTVHTSPWATTYSKIVWWSGCDAQILESESSTQLLMKIGFWEIGPAALNCLLFRPRIIMRRKRHMHVSAPPARNLFCVFPRIYDIGFSGMTYLLICHKCCNWSFHKIQCYSDTYYNDHLIILIPHHSSDSCTLCFVECAGILSFVHSWNAAIFQSVNGPEDRAPDDALSHHVLGLIVICPSLQMSIGAWVEPVMLLHLPKIQKNRESAFSPWLQSWLVVDLLVVAYAMLLSFSFKSHHVANGFLFSGHHWKDLQ